MLPCLPFDMIMLFYIFKSNSSPAVFRCHLCKNHIFFIYHIFIITRMSLSAFQLFNISLRLTNLFVKDFDRLLARHLDELDPQILFTKGLMTWMATMRFEQSLSRLNAHSISFAGTSSAFDRKCTACGNCCTIVPWNWSFRKGIWNVHTYC